jgi:hypothetical protein
VSSVLDSGGAPRGGGDARGSLGGAALAELEAAADEASRRAAAPAPARGGSGLARGGRAADAGDVGAAGAADDA